MTKAARIFEETRFECKMLMDRHGFERNPNGEAVGYNTLCTEEAFCVRTINAVQKELERRMKFNDLNKHLGIVNEEQYTDEAHVLEMVQATINNARRAIAF